MTEALPRHLEERTRRVGAPRAGEAPTHLASLQAGRSGEYLLYWMRTAVRGHENPALDVALVLARDAGVPVFVHHALSERYPYASDRHHTFILEGAADVEAELAGRGIGYAFHLERPGHRGPHLRTLAERAVAVVTEDMPVSPLTEWTDRLARSVDVPVLAVDTACVLPMRLTQARHVNRAYVFRSATESAREERLRVRWEDAATSGGPFVPDLPFEPVRLADADIPALVASCAVDHTIGPVPHTPGGSRAGYARWEEFRAGGLARYARDRNDPLRDGVSRMSAYLHYGQVSPFRLGRDALEQGSRGGTKYLDELLIWRELAHAFCFHRPDHATAAALPDWALDSLRQHEPDPRPALPSLEALERGRTGDALWDAAQRSLLTHGELHNNVRMTWGKAFIGWSRSVEEALERTIALNHRYALDGRDPASYGGILWCFGQFDRPFDPPRSITGRVRDRSTRWHAGRLNVSRYAALTGRPLRPHPARVAVIGAGVAGLTCARTLSDHGHPVVVFDKGRRVGGRASTREHGRHRFDHGAQYFSVRDPRLARRVRMWEEEGVVARWAGRIVTMGHDGDLRARDGERWVGRPGMQSLAAHLATDLDVRSDTRIVDLARRGSAWIPLDEHRTERGVFDVVVVAIPAPQAAELVPEGIDLVDDLKEVVMAPCWATMLTLRGPIDPGFDGAFVDGDVLAWIARDGDKPGRKDEDAWVLHASANWSREALERDREEVARDMIERFARLAGEPLDVAFSRAHRWRFAAVPRPLGTDCLLDPESAIGVCGDWCVEGRVEGAFLSGAAMAGRILGLDLGRPKNSREQTSLFEEAAP